MTRQKARDLCFPTKFLPKTLLRLARAVINQSLSPHNSTNHRAIAFYFGSNGQAYSNMRRRQYTSPERPYMGVPTTVTDAPGAATVINQVRHTSNGKLVLDESTRHMLPGGLAYDEHDQDDWYLGSNDPSDLGHIPKAYTPFATPSSIHPHIQLSFKPANLPPAQHHRDAQLTVCLQRAHENSSDTFIPLRRAIPRSAGIRHCYVCPTIDVNRDPLRHNSATNLYSAGSSVASTFNGNHNTTWKEGRDADSVHRNGHRHAIVHYRIRASHPRRVYISAPTDCPAIRRILLYNNSTEAGHQRMQRTEKSICRSQGHAGRAIRLSPGRR